MIAVDDSNVIPIDSARARHLVGRNDDELMRLSRAGKRDAFAALVGRHNRRLSDFCVKMTGDAETGRDLGQDVWVRVWAARDRYKPNGRFESFLFTVARNLCRNAKRDRMRRGKVIVAAHSGEEIDGARSTAPDHVDQVLAREQSQRVYAAVDRLAPKLREALLLRFAAGLDYAQISEVVGRGESTVRSRVYHGLKKLRSSLGELEVTL